MADELKPCPLCGPGRVDVVLNADTGLHDAVCRSCGLRAWIENWERRPTEDALRAEVAALKAELKKYTEPLTDEDEVAVDLLVDTEHSSIQDIDAAIREVRSK